MPSWAEFTDLQGKLVLINIDTIEAVSDDPILVSAFGSNAKCLIHMVSGTTHVVTEDYNYVRNVTAGHV